MCVAAQRIQLHEVQGKMCAPCLPSRLQMLAAKQNSLMGCVPRVSEEFHVRLERHVAQAFCRHCAVLIDLHAGAPAGMPQALSEALPSMQ